MGTTELIEKIRADGQARGEEINNERDNKIAEIRAHHAEELKELRKKYQDRIESETRMIKERARSRARLERRKRILAAKWAVIDHVLELAQQRVVENSDYVQLLKDIIKRFGSAGAVVRLSPKDTKKFAGKVNAKLGEPAPITGGVVIQAKKVLLDFSLEESLAAIREEMAAELAGLLFPKDRKEKRSAGS